jgi:CRP-like cAMP-binding protein
MYDQHSKAPTCAPTAHAPTTRFPDRVKTAAARISPPPTANRLLAKLPAAEYQHLAPHLELVAMLVDATIQESGEELGYAYFPIDGAIAGLNTLSDGSTTHISITGNEGMVGVSLYMGGQHNPSCAIVELAGHAYRLPANVLREEFARGGPFQHLLLRYAQALITEVTQNAVCNRHHSIEQQLCGLLLKFQDRTPGNQVNLTQETIAGMVGVRREGVTEAARHLQRAGVIAYRRGHITVLDRPALEKRVCECYAVVRKENDRLLGRLPPAKPRFGD